MKFTAYDIDGNKLGNVYAPNFATADNRASVLFENYSYVLEGCCDGD